MSTTITKRIRGNVTTLSLSESFADVAEVMAPLFDDESDHSDEPLAEIVWLHRPLRVVAPLAPLGPWDGAA